MGVTTLAEGEMVALDATVVRAVRAEVEEGDRQSRFCSRAVSQLQRRPIHTLSVLAELVGHRQVGLVQSPALKAWHTRNCGYRWRR